MKALLFFCGVFLFTSFSFSQSNDWEEFTDLIEKKHRPNEARVWLFKKLNTSLKKNDLYAIKRCFHSFFMTTTAMEQDERVRFFFKIDSLSRTLPVNQKNLTQLTLMNQMSSNVWLSYQMMSKPVIMGKDTFLLQSQNDLYQFVFERLLLIENDREQLKKVKLNDAFSFFTGTDTQLPTAYDYVTHELIRLYSSGQLTRWVESDFGYSVDKRWILAPKNFQGVVIEKKTFLSRTLALYQDLERFNQSNLELLTQFHYLRIKHLENYFSTDEIKAAHQEAFELYKEYSYRSKFLFEIALLKYREGTQYHFHHSPANEKFILDAYNMLVNEKKKFPKSNVVARIDNLMELIKSKELHVSMVNNLYPGEELPLKITYRNVDAVDIILLKDLSNKPMENYELFQNIGKEKLRQVMKKTIDLPNKGLMQKRSLETLLPKIESAGNYVVVVLPKGTDLGSLNKGNNNWGDVTASYAQLIVTTITAALETTDEGTRIIVSNYKTGEPIDGAKIDIYYTRFSEILEAIPVKKGRTDKNGFFESKLKYFQSFTCKIRHEDSEVLVGGYSYGTSAPQPVNSIAIFTDRSIYRPGQKLHFKAIHYTGNYRNNQYKVVPNKTLNVKLYDANYQLVETQEVLSNDFGSSSGVFNLPASGLLGRYSISIEESSGTHLASHSFNIEEYKRPTFQVTMEKPKTVVKLGDSVAVFGDVTAFAGFPLTDANVRYTVYRNPTYYWRYRPIGFNREGELMKTGEVKTDDQGRFQIDFLASAESKNEFGNFNFSIEAVVTDLSGETQKNQMAIMVSKTGLFLSYKGLESYISGQKEEAQLNLQNAFGVEQATKSGTLSLYRKKEPTHFIGRLWEDAEHQLFDSTVWENLFPYRKTSSFSVNGEELELVKEISFKTNEPFALNTLFDDLNSGNYVMKAFVLEGQDSILLNHQIEFINDNDMEYRKAQPLWIRQNYIESKVGEDIEIRYGSGFKEALVLVEVYSGRKKVSSEWKDVKGKDILKFTVKEEDRGGMSVYFYTVKNGIRYYQNVIIGVPFDNKTLQVKTSVFRDKLYPGQDEEWRFIVKDYKDGKVEAEVLASMYDASLDEFKPHGYYFWPYRNNYMYLNPSGMSSKSSSNFRVSGEWRFYSYRQMFNEPLYGGSPASYGDYGYYYMDGMNLQNKRLRLEDVALMPTRSAKGVASIMGEDDQAEEAMEESIPLVDFGDVGVVMDEETSSMKRQQKEKAQNQPQIRKNFDETAFFYPHLKTDENGEVVVTFTLPESLTKWNFKAFAHTKDVKIGGLDLTAVAQKELMIAPNAPRFYRRGDRAIFSTRLTNLSEEELDVSIELTFFNPVNEKEIVLFDAKKKKQKTKVAAGGNKAVEWEIDLKDAPDLIAYKIIAKSKDFSDGEQKVIPVLSNRQFVTEAFPFVTIGDGTHQFSFERFKKNTSTTLAHHNFSLEYTANPIWNVVLALPYMTDYPYECAEQVFTRFFANTLAAQVIGKKPELQKTLEIWKNHSPEVFMSELNKNEELKTVLLEETPWVVQAQNEEEQRRRIVELFDMNTLKNNLDRNLALLKRKQNRDGGFGWFGGNRSNLYITQHIISGFGYLKQLGVEFDNDTDIMIKKAVDFVSSEYRNAYRKMTKEDQEKLSASHMVIHWLYSISFFETNFDQLSSEMIARYRKSLEKTWMNFGLQEQALTGIYFKRTKGGEVAELIFKSLQDRSKFVEKRGRFFPENQGGYYWQRDKIGTHSMLLTFYNEMNAETQEIEELRLWLLLNKRSNHWGHTKNTAMATYAMLLTGKDFTSDQTVPTVKIGGETIMNDKIAQKEKKQIPFMGYFKQSWSKGEITKDLGDLVIEKTTTTPSYGAMYWQYFEDIDKVEESGNPDIDVTRKYELVVAGQKGKEYKKTKNYTIGDRIRITLTFETQNDLEYVHLKDLRPSGFEPLENLSRHHWDQGLWYYQSPRDASMNFFIDKLPRGSYTLTYEVFATAKGSFSAGNTTIQCMYAPEMVANSKGELIKVGD